MRMKALLVLAIIALSAVSVSATSIFDVSDQQCPDGMVKDWFGECVCAGGPYQGLKPPNPVDHCPGYYPEFKTYVPPAPRYI